MPASSSRCADERRVEPGRAHGALPALRRAERVRTGQRLAALLQRALSAG
jgi:hypothetical protein